uniref:MotA/TolQ/ExbB proton channel family protein n=1 Tax=Candidatus Kentrum sp. FM TaxID=2126340 RepID=A0A450SJB5_9GAMM|nr:MAG: MotA/TolQ/ExbB proton channel family protein [Candidatus Kentron sp. FM]VFJ53501.1 MAG: MotA/TolQ/ExbB proton channel family protein [Candidatus Kentron sp. FM]VFK06336.1 MAG: MotA/TolQ/ExbB proton channel family protein [Candidatus Kentron sp. FM]
MTFEFRPLWLLSLLFLLGISFAYLGWLQGRELPFFSLPALEIGSEGSVLHYAGMVLNRSLSTVYPALMLFLFFIFLVYAGIQSIGLAMDMRRHRQHSMGMSARNLPIRWATLIAPLLGRPTSRFTRIAQWSNGDWRAYCEQAPIALLSPITLAVQTFPLFGFVGTIAGIASALKYLPTGDNADASIASLTASLYTAFDTTFIGLIASLTLMLLSYGMEQGWTRMRRIAGIGSGLPS